MGTSLNLAVGSGQLASRATRTGCVMMWYCTSCSRERASAVAVGLAAQLRTSRHAPQPCTGRSTQLHGLARFTETLHAVSVTGWRVLNPSSPLSARQGMLSSVLSNPPPVCQHPLIAFFRSLSFVRAAREQAGGLFTAVTPFLPQSPNRVANAPSAHVVWGQIHYNAADALLAGQVWPRHVQQQRPHGWRCDGCTHPDGGEGQ